jgi:membrane protease YdiL (CAAX protease family)
VTVGGPADLPGGADPGPNAEDQTTSGAPPSPTEGHRATEPEPEGRPPTGPPGARIFSLDRPAAGLYLAAWLLALAATGAFFIGVVATNPAASAVLFVGGSIAFVLSFGAAAGYQVIARSGRPAGGYRGPSPLIAFGFTVALSSLLAIVLDISPTLSIQQALGFVLALVLVFAGYLITITLLVVRTGAISWAGLIRPSERPSARIIDFSVGALSGLVVVLPLALLGGLLAQALDVQASTSYPTIDSPATAVLMGIGVILVAPVGEELFFRGFALSAWWADLGAASALRRSAFFFAIVHVLNASGATFRDAAGGGLVQFVVIFPLALLLGVLYERRGLASSVGAHMAYNAGVFALALLAGGSL